MKNVEFVVTRKPFDLARRIASIAASKTPVAVDGRVVTLLQPVEVDHPREVRRRLEPVDPPLQEDRIRAEVDEPLAPDETLDHLLDLGVEQRLAPGDRDHRRAALLDRGERRLWGHALTEDLRRVLDLAATGTGEIAREERFELDDQRVLLAFRQPLTREIRRHEEVLSDRYGHQDSPACSWG